MVVIQVLVRQRALVGSHRVGGRAEHVRERRFGIRELGWRERGFVDRPVIVCDRQPVSAAGRARRVEADVVVLARRERSEAEPRLREGDRRHWAWNWSWCARRDLGGGAGGRGGAANVGDAAADREATGAWVGVRAAHVESTAGSGRDRAGAGAAVVPRDLGREVTRAGCRVGVGEMCHHAADRLADGSRDMRAARGQQSILHGGLKHRRLRAGRAETLCRLVVVGHRPAVAALLGIAVGALNPRASVRGSGRSRAVPSGDRRA